jgi:hypothetical protein
MAKTVEDIEKAVSELPQDQLRIFDAWDEQIEKDAVGGKLDAPAEAAIADHKAGKSKEL